ncbi:MAG: hypothetical protein PUF51_02820 [Bifidobacteriaceae bacterium]|nr:hypothetical protein [Bifidobacteriaceae bacterium]
MRMLEGHPQYQKSEESIRRKETIMKHFVRAVACVAAAVCMMFGGAGTALAEGGERG